MFAAVLLGEERAARSALFRTDLSFFYLDGFYLRFGLKLYLQRSVNITYTLILYLVFHYLKFKSFSLQSEYTISIFIIL